MSKSISGCNGFSRSTGSQRDAANPPAPAGPGEHSLHCAAAGSRDVLSKALPIAAAYVGWGCEQMEAQPRAIGDDAPLGPSLLCAHGHTGWDFRGWQLCAALWVLLVCPSPAAMPPCWVQGYRQVPAGWVLVVFPFGHKGPVKLFKIKSII